MTGKTKYVRRWRRPNQHTHTVRQPGSKYIVLGAGISILSLLLAFLMLVGYLSDRRAVADTNRERIEREVSEVRDAVCDALAVTVMGATDPAVLARADAAGAELECDPPPSQREVDGYPVPTPVPPATPGAPQGASQPAAPESAPEAAEPATGAPEPPAAAPAPPVGPTPGTVEPAPAPSAPVDPAPPVEPDDEPALLDPVLEPVCDLLGVCLGD